MTMIKNIALATCVVIMTISCSMLEVRYDDLVQESSAVSRQAKRRVTVAVIDSGFDMDAKWKATYFRSPRICKNGTYSVVEDLDDTMYRAMGLPTSPKGNDNVYDGHGHGTHIAGIIGRFAGEADYCLYIIKYWTKEASDMAVSVRSIEALKIALDLKVDVINYSGGGTKYLADECEIVKALLDRGTVFFAAAGNEGKDIASTPFYPASCDPRVIKVGATYRDSKKRYDRSNYSTSLSDRYIQEPGVGMLSILPGGQYGYMTGTSQATAVATGKFVKKLSFAETKRGR